MAEQEQVAAHAIESSPPRRGLGFRILTWTLVVALVLGVLGVAGFGVFYAMTPIPDPDKDFSTANTHLMFADGETELGTLAVQNREEISYEEMPQYIKDAIVAAENPTFWTDPGISFSGILRAISTINSGQLQGGSTLTQQYVKVLYLSQEKTLTRKLKEIVIALKLGGEVPKEDILAGYLNTVYYGRGAYGIQAAAQAYFGIDAADLDLQQSIALASIVNAPGLLDPAQGTKQAQDLLERYQYTINAMVQMGTLTEEQKAEIYYALPEFPQIQRDARYGGTNGFLMKMVEAELKSGGFDESTINGGGLTVITTFDAGMQDAAVSVAQAQAKAAAAERKKNAADLHPSIVSIDNATGGVLALYGGNADYTQNSRNWATTARATGSTFKPWALVAALREGFSLSQPLNGDEFTPKGEKSPVTNGGAEYGTVTLKDATTKSINTAYVDLTLKLEGGPEAVLQAANDAGLPTAGGWDVGSRVAMGIAEVSPVDAASGYSTLANSGLHRPWHVVSEVKDRGGNVIYTADTEGTQTIETEVAEAATQALTAVAESGTGRVVAGLGKPVAGKTGTRYDNTGTRASWFVGYTMQVTTAVNFVAGDTGSENLDLYSQGFYGSGYPARTWLAYMQKATKGMPSVKFPTSTYKPNRSLPAPTSTRRVTQAPSAAPEEEEPTPEVTTPDGRPSDQAGGNDRGNSGTESGGTGDGGDDGEGG